MPHGPLNVKFCQILTVILLHYSNIRSVTPFSVSFQRHNATLATSNVMTQ